MRRTLYWPLMTFMTLGDFYQKTPFFFKLNSNHHLTMFSTNPWQLFSKLNNTGDELSLKWPLMTLMTLGDFYQKTLLFYSIQFNTQQILYVIFMPKAILNYLNNYLLLTKIWQQTSEGLNIYFYFLSRYIFNIRYLLSKVTIPTSTKYIWP